MTESEIRTETMHVFDSKYGSITSGLWVPDRNIILAGTDRGRVVVADMEEAKEVNYRLYTSEMDWITSISLSPNERVLVVTRRGGDYYIYEFHHEF